ncbi:SIS domain-containing protein [Rubellimicrobium sp. CFH 75288]|uniref:SIS domain-containing protein n=1 Tax=Rubellimicrobium sp. CFH 75288 TaxID=2697034 RepID=UPI001412D940|nr:SIS domain-containing protein [Rubellimicrobium sp. CFH 75288]NAZ36477.1 SIS domain-containing protein [Rubellimicrobium sp. CFH 75288]
MLNFDPDRFLHIQQGACRRAQEVGALVRDLVADGADSLFFLGSGGAGLLMQPAADLLGRRSGLAVFAPPCPEIVLTGHRAMGERSVAILPSLSGTTRETVAALDWARSCGATTIALVGDADTPLGSGAHHCFANAAADDTSCEMFHVLALAAALGAMEAHGEMPEAGRLLAELEGLPDRLLAAKRAFEPRAAELAGRLAERDWHIVTAAGTVWPQAHYYGMCILEEMQWIRTRPVHAADFFHGTLELVEPGVSVLVMAGEDEARPLTDRVIAFARQYTDRLLVLDSADLAAEGLPTELRALLAPALLATALERVSAHLEVLRDHPLVTRRYYRRVAY